MPPSGDIMTVFMFVILQYSLLLAHQLFIYSIIFIMKIYNNYSYYSKSKIVQIC